MNTANNIKVYKIDTEDQLNDAFSIRQEVFVEEQEVDSELEYDEFEDISTHFLAVYENTPVGTCRWRKTKNGIKLERFAVVKDKRERFGVGSALMREALKDISSYASNKDKEQYLHAQIQVVDFYKKFGFHPIGNQFEEAGIQHFKMIKTSF